MNVSVTLTRQEILDAVARMARERINGQTGNAKGFSLPSSVKSIRVDFSIEKKGKSK